MNSQLALANIEGRNSDLNRYLVFVRRTNDITNCDDDKMNCFFFHSIFSWKKKPADPLNHQKLLIESVRTVNKMKIMLYLLKESCVDANLVRILRLQWLVRLVHLHVNQIIAWSVSFRFVGVEVHITHQHANGIRLSFPD